MKKLNQNGSHVVAILAVIVVLGVVGFAGWRVFGKKKDAATASNDVAVTEPSPANGAKDTAKLSWSFDGNNWKVSGNPDACPVPPLEAPVDISKATAVLYPGQTRGGNYKAHGGFIFKGSKNDDITVKVPIDSVIVKGSRYIEQGEVQYMFIGIAPCGLMYRFDHLLTLSPTFQALADKLPEAKVDDSRTTNFTPTPTATAGEIVATAVGFKKTNNVSVDFGVYDLRQPNDASKIPAYAKAHEKFKETEFYGVCWFDMFKADYSASVKVLPAGDEASGKTSDYCK